MSITTAKTYLHGLRDLLMVGTLLAMPLAAATSRIYVLNNAGTTISVIDPSLNKVVQTIGGIEVPEAAHFSPDGSRIYVSNGSENFLDVLDRNSGKPLKRVPISGHANDLAVTPNGKRVLVCIADTPGALDIIDTASLEKVKSIPVKSRMHDVVVTEDGKYAVADSPEGKFAAFFDLTSEQLVGQMDFDQRVMPIVIENGPGGSARRLFVQLDQLNGFVVVDFAKRQETARIKLPDEPSGYFNAAVPSHGMGVAPDGKTFWITSRPANSVFVYSLPDLKLLGRVSLPELKLPGKSPIGAGPNWLTFTGDSKTVYIANRSLKSVTAIDVKTMKVVATIPVGEAPDRVSTLVLP
jgi:YVTN family beta-propeller protein